MSGGNVILNNSEIQELVEISMLLGCTADMIKEPKVDICFLIFVWTIDSLKLFPRFVCTSGYGPRGRGL